ncbi:hypothetical protein HT031_003711 [Scenedesmus sp. PABB004]|nr:hypothetical protein HT031_003711 [Scenedesmus sp. PABB004]
MNGDAGGALPPGFAEPLVDRLAGAPAEQLHLPAAMARGAGGPPEPADVRAHLAALLARDPAVFLERYGPQLTAEELDGFSGLQAASYEGARPQRAPRGAAATFARRARRPPARAPRRAAPRRAAAVEYWVKAARAATQPGPPPAPATSNKKVSKTVANRRLAYMQRLVDGGEFFSEDAMRSREPLIWHELIGQFEGMPPPSGPPTPGEGFAGSLLRAHDEALLRVRLQQQLDEEECQASEHEASDSGDEQQQEQQQPGGDTAMQEAGGGQRAARRQARGAAAAPAEPPPPDMSAAAMRARRQELLEEMQSRFLLGLESAHVAYGDIDGDAALDDAWAAVQDQDAADAWFDDM